VLHVIASISPERGGPSWAVRTILKALARRGVVADVATTDDDGNTRRLQVPYDEFVALDEQRARFFPRGGLQYSMSYPLARWLRRNVRDYDIVHTHGLFNFPPVAAAWHAKHAGVPYIMALHGVLDTWGIRNKSATVKALSIRLVEGPLLRDAAAAHFMSELEASRAAQLGLPMRPVVLPLGFEFDTAQDEQAPSADFASGDRPLILYMARIHPVKQVDVLLRAFASIPRDSPLLAIAGDGDPALVASLKRLASDLGLDARVRWLGFVEGARKRWLLSHASAFVLPSASENFGVAILEAMHAAVPVVVTRGAGLAGMVSAARAGLVTDGSVEGLCSALTQLLDDASLRCAMGEAGQRTAQQQFSLDVFGARLENFYRAVLNGAVAARAAEAMGGLPP